MIKTLVKLALAALIANAVWRVGTEYITEFKFRDAVREAAVYEGRGDFDLRQRIAALALQFDLPLDDDAVKIERTGGHVIVRGAYDKPIELVPGYPYVWRFAWTVDADLVRPGPGAAGITGETDGRSHR
jgi:hypothetical protein